MSIPNVSDARSGMSLDVSSPASTTRYGQCLISRDMRRQAMYSCGYTVRLDSLQALVGYGATLMARSRIGSGPGISLPLLALWLRSLDAPAPPSACDTHTARRLYIVQATGRSRT